MKLFLGSLVCLFAVITSPAFAQQTTNPNTIWLNIGTGTDFATSANWSNGLPTPTTIAYVEPGYTASVSGGPSNIFITNNAGDQTAYQLLVAPATNGLSFGTATISFNNGTALQITNGMGVFAGDTLNFSGNITALGGTIVSGDTSNVTGGNALTSTFNYLSGTINGDNVGTGAGLWIGVGAVGIFNQGSSTTSATINVGGGTSKGTGVVIGDGSIGTYNLLNQSVLNFGNLGAPQASTYLFVLGYNDNSIGTLNISGNSTINSSPTVNNGWALGDGTSSYGIVTQSGTSTVNWSGDFFMGYAASSIGLYYLQSGNLNLTKSNVIIGDGASSLGYLSQTGGTMTVGASGGDSTTFGIGKDGSGEYDLSGGTAIFNTAFNVGGLGSGTGVLSQTGGTLTANSQVILGGTNGTGTGDYILSGGTATFNANVVVNATGTFELAGGTIVLGSTNSFSIQGGGAVTQLSGNYTFTDNQIDLTKSGSNYDLDGGILSASQATFKGAGGNLNFGGGKLLITAGDVSNNFTDFYSGTLSGTSTIDASTTTINTFTFNGILSDGFASGGLILIGSPSTHFAFGNGNANSYTGVTELQDGVLDAQTANVEYSSQIQLDTGTTFNLTSVSNSHDAMAGGITGGPSTALNIAFNGNGDTILLAGNNNFTGALNLGTTANTGTLQVYNGTFTAINSTNGSGLYVGGATMANGTALPDGFTPPSSGTVTLTGTDSNGNFVANTYTGMTTVDSGFTLNAQNLAGDATIIGKLNITSVSNISIAGSVTNTGVISSSVPLSTSPATHNPTLTIGGDLDSSAGMMLVRINPQSGNSDYFQVAGNSNVDLTGLTIDKNQAVGTKTYLILTTGGTLTSQASASIASQDLFTAEVTQISDPSSPYYQKGLILTTSQSFLSPYATTPAGAAVAKSLDPITQTPPDSFVPLLAVIDSLPASQVGALLQALSPAALQYSPQIAFENSTFLVQQVNGAMANIRSGYEGFDASGINVIRTGFNSGIGQSLNQFLAYNPPSFNRAAPNGVNYYPQDSGSSYSPTAPAPEMEPSSANSVETPTMSDTANPNVVTSPTSRSHAEPDFKGPHMTEFLLGNVILADLNENPGNSKASYNSGSVTGGISFKMTSNLAAGVLFDYNYTEAKTDAMGSKTKVNTFSPGLFATFFKDGFYANGLFSFGYNTYKNTRNIGVAIPGSGSTATSSPDGQQYVGNLDLGYDFQPKKAREWIFGPTLGFTYVHLDENAYTESGAGPANLSINDQSADSLRSRLGGHVTYQVRAGSILFQPSVVAMWQHEFLDNNAGINGAFNLPGSTPFTLQSAQMSKDSALLGAGVNATLDNSMVLYLNYLANVGTDGYLAQSIIGGLKASF